MGKDWFRKNSNDILQELETDIDSGLSAETAARRLETQGPNELAEAEKQSTLGLLLQQFKNPLLIILNIGRINGEKASVCRTFPLLPPGAVQKNFY